MPYDMQQSRATRQTGCKGKDRHQYLDHVAGRPIIEWPHLAHCLVQKLQHRHSQLGWAQEHDGCGKVLCSPQHDDHCERA